MSIPFGKSILPIRGVSSVLRFLSKRLFSAVLLLFIIVTMTFFLVRCAPGGPFDRERKMTEQARKNMLAKHGFDKPLTTQYFLYISRLLQGDLGESFQYENVSVSEIIAEHAPYSFLLGALALLVALITAIPLGIRAAEHEGGRFDGISRAGALFFVSIPGIVLAPLAILFFAFVLGVLPAGLWTGLPSLILPVLTLALPFASRVFLLTREKACSAYRSEYTRAAIARGVGKQRLRYTHILKNSLIPVVSYIAPGSAALLTGSIVVETIYVLPGLGKYFVQSAFNRDYFLMSGVLILYFGLLVILNMLADIAVQILDPRSGASQRESA